ncbi:hypothetical protein FPQ18DRAFT_392722 [Pyronema domesticum]|uniref:Uncharacterized protein n=1 Tax=Pyronema omphalodes (strain CBS 100304) TaxID=1076935 RepID=U4L7C0_PYROM|nr:hypothetical protein FPQ18DRAFT_392722 [Pyronema domesticum]CCX12493.1 Protein of unknown function [Pyronema omphalodes CBS 100304]
MPSKISVDSSSACDTADFVIVTRAIATATVACSTTTTPAVTIPPADTATTPSSALAASTSTSTTASATGISTAIATSNTVLNPDTTSTALLSLPSALPVDKVTAYSLNVYLQQTRHEDAVRWFNLPSSIRSDGAAVAASVYEGGDLTIEMEDDM